MTKLGNFYRRIERGTDQQTFTRLFNFKAFLQRSPARLRWTGTRFLVTDVSRPKFQYQIRHQRQCLMAYERGITHRAEKLADDYFLEVIDFAHKDIVLDCGANVGDLKIWFDLKGLDIDYVGFEPAPIEFECLRENVFPSHVHNVGLWSTEGTLTFYLSSQGADSSLIAPPTYDTTVSVRVDKIENFIHGPVKLLKLEAEGAEPEILEGLGDRLASIEYISADLGFERGVASESTLVPVVNYLLARNFELVEVQHGRITALFKNKKAR